MKRKSSQSLLSFALCLTLLILVCLGCNPRELPFIRDVVKGYESEMTDQTEEAIRNSTELQELNNVCKQIPLPQDFKFVWLGGLDDEKVTLSYYFYGETKYEEARHFWVQYFERNDWKFIKENDSYPKTIEYRNARFRIEIQHGGMGKRTNYSINCEKLQ